MSSSSPAQTHYMENRETSEAEIALRGRKQSGRSGKIWTQDLHAQMFDKAACKFQAAKSDVSAEALVDGPEEASVIDSGNVARSQHKPKVKEPKLGEFDDYKGHMTVIGTLHH